MLLVASVLYCVLELLLGNMDVVMTNMSSGSSRLSETRHISYSCGHTAVLLVLLGLTREFDHVLFNFLCCSLWHCHFTRVPWHNRNLNSLSVPGKYKPYFYTRLYCCKSIMRCFLLHVHKILLIIMVKNNHPEMVWGISGINILLIDGPNYLDHYKSTISSSWVLINHLSKSFENFHHNLRVFFHRCALEATLKTHKMHPIY